MPIAGHPDGTKDTTGIFRVSQILRHKMKDKTSLPWSQPGPVKQPWH